MASANEGTVTTQPQSADQKAPGSTGPVTIRTLTDSKEDCEFAAGIIVEGFRDKFIHGTSERSLPKVKAGFALDHQKQDPIFYQHNFVAEYDGKPAGLMALMFEGEKPIRIDEKNHYEGLGCCESCGLSGVFGTLYATEVSNQNHCYLDHIAVDANVRGKGIGKVLLDRADYEARQKGCGEIYLYVANSNRAKHLYERQGYRKSASHWFCGCLWCSVGECIIIKMTKNL